ncbi:MAG: site-2 protease family protein [Chloroflexota bacterium]
MKWQWKIGRFFGIDVFIHATFLLLIIWVGFSYWLAEQNLAAVLSGIGFILLLFALVVLHEYGHALTARRFGVKTRDITLYPIGGVASLERMPEKPSEELLVAIAGPAVNVVIGAALFAWLFLTDTWEPVTALTLSSGPFVERLALVNLSLVLFNILPAFPMDGGRVLRALLAMRMDYVHATQAAAAIGQGMAFLFGLFGLFGNPLLLFIAFFVWIGASQEANMAQMKTIIGGIPVGRVMFTDFEKLAPSDPLSRMSQLILSGSQHDFPVMDDGHIVGVVTRNDFLSALAEKGQNVAVSAIMRRDLPEVDSHEMIETALNRIEESGVPALPVTHGGRLVGIVTNENITDFLMIRSALRSNGKKA